MMSVISLESYGGCLHNSRKTCPRGSCSKVKTASKYPFSVAIENKIQADYVTEKFFEAFLSGSLPVYLGSPAADLYAPGPHSFINAHHFKSGTELAKYLQRVRSDSKLYESYFAWKSDPQAKTRIQQLINRFRHGDGAGYCKLCEAYVRKYGCRLLVPVPADCPSMARDSGWNHG